ncbi:MAG: TetR/AcrR family transcriptional regulator [Actinobacteria bacterium]|nr:TetR/AcrR family transcriptional regulator [Actinomycetota bacterium]
MSRPQSLGDDDPLGGRLLEAAVVEFAARGYAGARVAEIAARAGVTTGAIYSRYRGKAELLAEAIEWATNDEFDRLFTDHRFEGRMEDVLRIVGQHLIVREERCDDGTPSGDGLLLESFAAARQEPDVRRLLGDHLLDRHGRLVRVVDAAKDTGGIDPDVDTNALVTFCYALGLGFVLLEVVDMPVPERDAWDALIERLLDAIAERPPARVDAAAAASGTG